MSRPALLLVLLCGACASGPATDTIDAQRKLNEEALASNAAAIDATEHARRWVVVQKGIVVASASLPDDAVRAAQAKDAPASHRFVFRPGDRGTPLYRLAYLAEGGVVVGRRFLADLSLEAAGAAGRPPVVRRKTGGTGVDLAQTRRLVIEIASLDASVRRTISAAYDPDFDGGLLVTREVAAALHLERFEIPGGAQVQVALGRPFRAHRATVIAKIQALETSGPAEVVYETAPRRK